MLCKYCRNTMFSHGSCVDSNHNCWRFCPTEIWTPMMNVKTYEPMTNLEYLEYQYEKTQAV